MSYSRIGLIIITLFIFIGVKAQQVPDPDFKPPIEKPAYAEGKGPVVLIDEAHFNFHTASGRYQTFADLLRRDGYVVQASKENFSKESLKAGKILVIANALSQRNGINWNPPFDPSFTDEEIAAVREWVNQGRSSTNAPTNPSPIIRSRAAGRRRSGLIRWRRSLARLSRLIAANR